MWSAALQEDVERFAVNSVADAAECKAPSCRTNSLVESQFKSVKHSRLEGRMVVRETAGVCDSGTDVHFGEVERDEIPEGEGAEKDNSVNGTEVEMSQTPHPLLRRARRQ